MPIDRVFRDIKEAMEAGGETAESLVEKFADRGIDTSKKLTNQIKLIQAMGFYPVPDEDGVYSFITEEEFDEIETKKDEKKAEPTFTKNPQNRLISAMTKLDNKLTATSNAQERFTKNKVGDVVLKLKAAKADIDYRIAKIELLRLKQKLMAELGIDTIDKFDAIEDLDEVQAERKKALGIEDTPTD